MKKNANYEINFATNTITVSKRFLAAASQMGTEEFDIMSQLRGLNMNICVRTIHKGKPNETRWSFERMERFIRNVEGSDHYLADFQKMVDNYGYMKVWAWFKETFANYKTAPLNENHQFITKTKEQMETEKKAKLAEKRTRAAAVPAASSPLGEGVAHANAA